MLGLLVAACACTPVNMTTAHTVANIIFSIFFMALFLSILHLALVQLNRCQKHMELNCLEKTISLNPNAPYIVGVAGWHMAIYGEWERGLKLLKKGITEFLK